MRAGAAGCARGGAGTEEEAVRSLEEARGGAYKGGCGDA